MVLESCLPALSVRSGLLVLVSLTSAPADRVGHSLRCSQPRYVISQPPAVISQPDSVISQLPSSSHSHLPTSHSHPLSSALLTVNPLSPDMSQIVDDMFRLWTLAEEDLLAAENPYVDES